MKKILLFITAIFICGASIAQTETTKWYIEGELYDTTSCESGDDITMPQVPERFGYTFSGWEPAVYDMSTLDATINATDSSYSNMIWKVKFNYGWIYGESICSDGLPFYPDGEMTSNGNACFCRVTDFVPVDSYKIYETKYSKWVWAINTGRAPDCPPACANVCRNKVYSDASFRANLLSPE